MAFTEDLSEFFDNDDFAVAATITGITGSVYGIYDKEYVEVSIGSIDVVGYKPTFTCQTSDITDVDRTTMVTIAGETETFIISHIENQGDGISRIILEEV